MEKCTTIDDMVCCIIDNVSTWHLIFLLPRHLRSVWPTVYMIWVCSGLCFI